jgi:hypothetical protein
MDKERKVHLYEQGREGASVLARNGRCTSMGRARDRRYTYYMGKKERATYTGKEGKSTCNDWSSSLPILL